MEGNDKLKLYGFNNLTKNLSFSFYKLHYLSDSIEHQKYNHHINQCYSAEKLTLLLTDICHAIGGNVLNIAQQNYEPQGASVTLMMSEEAEPLAYPESVVAHLDKSHICVHTYPDDNIQHNIAIFRADIELSTCGVISPLKVLNYLIEKFDADVIDIDYRVRGMTRTSDGEKVFIDDKIQSVSQVLNTAHNEKYHSIDNNLAKQNLFHTKLRKIKICLHSSFFGSDNNQLTGKQSNDIIQQLEAEVQQLFDSQD